MDYQASHDLEDFVAVIEGRESVLEEIAESPGDLQDYLAEAARGLLSESRFLDVLPGFVLDDERVPIIRERLRSIAAGIPRATPKTEIPVAESDADRRAALAELADYDQEIDI